MSLIFPDFVIWALNSYTFLQNISCPAGTILSITVGKQGRDLRKQMAGLRRAAHGRTRYKVKPRRGEIIIKYFINF